MALILADARRASAAGAVSGAKEKRLLNLAFVSSCYWGGVVSAATYDQKRMVYYINGTYQTGGTWVGGTTAFRYESPAIAEAVYNWMINKCAVTEPTTIAFDMAQDTEILSLTSATAAAGVPIAITSDGLFINGGTVTLNSIAGSEQISCDTRFGSENEISFVTPSGMTAARVYDVVWTHPNGNYAFILAAFTA